MESTPTLPHQQVRKLVVQHWAACFVLNRPWKEITGQHH